jgi:3-phenylpropionate/cinnamic acid dioxygenase small subunit
MAQAESVSLEQLHEDDRQVRNLIARLAHLADYGDLDEYLSLYTDDAVWEWGEVRNEGPAAIRADRMHRRGTGGQGPATRTRHVVTTMWIDVDGSDVATAHSYWVYVQQADTSPVLASTGRYHDTLRRTSTGWKMAHRRSIPADS